MSQHAREGAGREGENRDGDFGAEQKEVPASGAAAEGLHDLQPGGALVDLLGKDVATLLRV